MDIRFCLEHERDQAIDLICRVFKPPMFEEYPLLLGPNNRSHMWVAVDHDAVVASVNYYVTPIILGPMTLQVASIGAVCTDPTYRGQGLASQLLEKSREQMEEEHVDLVVISGGLPIYRRFGADNYSRVYEFTIDTPSSNIDLQSYHVTNLNDLYRIHIQQSIRYIRTIEEMGTLINAILTPDPYEDHYVECIVRNQLVVGYLVIEKNNHSGVVRVREYGGSSQDVYEGLKAFLTKYRLSKLHFPLIHNDSIVQFLIERGCSYKINRLESTMRIISFNHMMRNLHPYFASKLNDDTSNFKMYQNEEGYHIEYKDTSFVTTSLSDVQEIIFNGAESFETMNSSLKLMMNSFFPLPFVYPSGLNYQ